MQLPLLAIDRALRVFLAGIVFGIASFVQFADAAERPPNIVIIFADDLGYGDLACYGHPTIRTPNLDRMAAEGMRFTQFYSASSVCTPSRAALMTGRLPIRNGMCSDTRRVLFPDSAGGLPSNEITIAEALKQRGYATACIGKWHLGHLPEFLPTQNGFDSYFGIPYSNDMDRAPDSKKGRAAFLKPKIEYWNVPLMRDEQIVERPADQRTITRRYTEEAVKVIRQNRTKPFLIYLAHSLPHVPLFASNAFLGTSPRGLFGDVIEEIDWSVGRILETLRSEGLDQNTLVFFTSDNGPWLAYNEHGGSAGLLREGKGMTWDGGMREPCIVWWPSKIRPGTVTQGLASTMDIFTTSLRVAGGSMPDDRIVDGVDMTPILFGSGKSNRDTVFYYRGTRIYAVRKGPFKAHYITQPAYRPGKAEKHDPPILYNLEHDVSERFDVAEKRPDVLKVIAEEVSKHRALLVPGKPQLDKRISNP